MRRHEELEAHDERCHDDEGGQLQNIVEQRRIDAASAGHGRCDASQWLFLSTQHRIALLLRRHRGRRRLLFRRFRLGVGQSDGVDGDQPQRRVHGRKEQRLRQPVQCRRREEVEFGGAQVQHRVEVLVRCEFGPQEVHDVRLVITGSMLKFTNN